MKECEYCIDEICVNADCPMRADFCPVSDIPDVCKYEKWSEENGQFNNRHICRCAYRCVYNGTCQSWE